MQRFSARILSFAMAALCALSAGSPSGAAAATSVSGYVAPMSPGFAQDLYSLPTTRRYGAFVHFKSGTPAAHKTLLSSYGLNVTADFEKSAKAVFAVGTIGAFRNLSGNLAVGYLENNTRLKYFGGTNSWATRARVTQENVSGGPYLDGAGNVLRGQGQTIVVVDSGLNAVHPDFAGRVKHNYKVVCPLTPFLVDDNDMCAEAQYVDVGMTSTDTTGGHGTHCAGIAAGSGQASTGDYPVAGAAPNVKGTYTGVAPDANLIMYGVGEGINVLYAAEAFQHILDNWDPTIKVISNSYGNAAGTAWDPNGITAKLDKALVDKGAVVVYAAGNGDTLNDGGDGSDDRTSATCKDPYPGVICVANYDDNGTGSRGGSLDFSSSRGHIGHPSEYPDIAAPGSLITATCLQPVPGQAVCATGAEVNWQPYYGTISGTSMATPHVAGAVALIRQAQPGLTPAQVEDLIQDTAFKVGTNGAYEADPQNAGSTINFGLGAGLLDVPAALDAKLVTHGAAPASGTTIAIFDGYNMVKGGAENVVGLTMTETTVGPATGIRYQLKIPAVTAFTNAPSGVLYTLTQDVDGREFQTTISSTADGVANVAGGSGNATNVTRAPHLVSFFVPYVQLGSPAVGAPIHNISVTVYDAATGVAMNVVPHPANSTVAQQLVQPMFGKPFTVQLATTSGGSTESSCTVPGLTIMTDGSRDALVPVPGTDVQGLQIALPHATSAADAKVVFTLSTDRGDQYDAPGAGWYVSFFNPRTHTYHGARMVYRTTSPSFESYVPSVSLDTGNGGTTDGRFADTYKPADPNSNYDRQKGKITIIVPVADLDLLPGDTIGGFVSGSTFTTNPEDLPIPQGTEVWDAMPDSFAYTTGSFAVYDATGSTCPAAASPAARLNPTALSFPDQAVGTTSAAKSVVYTNVSTRALSINTVTTASQSSVAEFNQTNDCPATLAVGRSCTIKVKFAPKLPTARTGTLSIVAENGRRTDTVSLTGTGK